MPIRRKVVDYVVYCLLLTLVPLITLLPSRPAGAQTSSAPNRPGINVEISPLPIELSAKPGTSVSADLRVRNSGSSAEKLKLSLKTFTTEGADGRIVLHDPVPADDFIKWVSFSKPVFDAPAGQWQTIKMNVSLPASAAFGYYYAVQVELANPPKPQPGATSLQGAVVIFVLLNAEAPGAVKKAEVTRFSADRQAYEFLPAGFSVQLRNLGNVHVAPHGNIFIKRGKVQVGSIAVNSGLSYVLPGSNRIFKASWSDGFPVYTDKLDAGGLPVKDAKGQIERQLKWNFSQVSRLRFGHYTADLLLIYNDGKRDIPISGSLSFWVIPWRVVGGLLVVIILMVIGLWSSFGRLSRFARRLGVKIKGGE